MPTKQKSDLVQPIDCASFDLKDERGIVINPNEIYEASHRYVKAKPHLFRPVEQTRERPSIEQMTAAPGEVRG